VVAASAEPQRAAVVLRLANLVVVNQPLPARVPGRHSSTSERSRLSRHHAASQADAARRNQVAVHLPLRHVLQSAERKAERVLLLVPRKVQTVPLHVRATVLLHVHLKRVAVLLLVHQSVLLPADLPARAVPLQLAEHVLQPVDQKVPTAPHHVRQSVLLPVVLREPTVLHHVPKLVALRVDQVVLQPAVPKVPAAATIVAVQMLAKSLS
jgi:hypothetical protein